LPAVAAVAASRNDARGQRSPTAAGRRRP